MWRGSSRARGISGPAALTRFNTGGRAPGERILNRRCRRNGRGYVSDASSRDWCVTNKSLYNIRSSTSRSATRSAAQEIRPVVPAVETCRQQRHGGGGRGRNLGKSDGRTIYGGISTRATVRRPSRGAADTHDTVVRGDDTVASYSSRGPTLFDGRSSRTCGTGTRSSRGHTRQLARHLLSGKPRLQPG